MQAHRHTRATLPIVALAVPFALLLALPTTAQAAEPVSPPAPGTTAPPAVLASVAPGGEAYRAAARGVAVEGDGPVPTSQSTTLGTPRAIVDYRDDAQTGPALTPAELVSESEPSEPEWLVVATKDGQPTEFLRLASDGHVVSDGAGPAARGAAIDALPVDALLLVAGTPVRSAYYTVGDDRRSVVPLDAAAREASGDAPLTVAAFRSNQREVAADWRATSDGLVPETPQHGTDLALFFSILGVVGAGAVVWALVARRRRHHHALSPAT